MENINKELLLNVCKSKSPDTNEKELLEIINLLLQGSKGKLAFQECVASVLEETIEREDDGNKEQPTSFLVDWSCKWK